MRDTTHPGPASIEPGECPRGVVIHVYGVPSGKLLNTSKSNTPSMAAFQAGIDHATAERNLPPGDDAFCLVAFDGDSGMRFSALDWLRGTA